MHPAPRQSVDFSALAIDIKRWGQELGFQQVGIADVALPEAERRLLDWLAQQYHGEMHYMARHGTRRSRPQELVPGTLRVICARLDYLPVDAADMQTLLHQAQHAYISRYALGRDYHKVIRRKLQHLAERIEQVTGPFGYRAFTDSAPVMEKPLASAAGLGWIGKHTNLIHPQTGSWFFSASCSRTCPCPWTPRHRTIAAPATPVWIFVQPKRSSPLMSWMRGVAFRISPSNCTAPFRWNSVRSWVTASMAVMTANWCAPGIDSRNPPAMPTLRRATASMRRLYGNCLPGAKWSS